MRLNKEQIIKELKSCFVYAESRLEDMGFEEEDGEYATIRDFSDCLAWAIRNTPIENKIKVGFENERFLIYINNEPVFEAWNAKNYSDRYQGVHLYWK